MVVPIVQTPSTRSRNKLDILRQKTLIFCADILHPEIEKVCSRPLLRILSISGTKLRSPLTRVCEFARLKDADYMAASFFSVPCFLLYTGRGKLATVCDS